MVSVKMEWSAFIFHHKAQGDKRLGPGKALRARLSENRAV